MHVNCTTALNFASILYNLSSTVLVISFLPSGFCQLSMISMFLRPISCHVGLMSPVSTVCSIGFHFFAFVFTPARIMFFL